MSAPYLGDIAEDATIRFLWSTNDGAGASITRATDGTVQVYKDNGTTQSTAGITDTEDFDSLTGIHACTIDTSADAFYATGSDYTVVLSGATIDGESVNAVLAHFSIENRFDEVDLQSIAGDQTAVGNLADAFDGTGYDVGGIDVSELNAAVDAVGTDGSGLTEAGGTGDHLSAVPWNASWDAEVESEVEDAIQNNNLDHLMKTPVADGNDMTTEVPDGTVLSHALTKAGDTSTYSDGTDSLEGLADLHAASKVAIDRIEVDTQDLQTQIGTAGDGLTAIPAVYHADIELTVDDANSKDEWTVIWFKDAVPQTSGVTSPQIQVVKRADGTDLIAADSMTEIGSTETFKYDESTNRTTAGEAVVVVVTATIDGSTRTWKEVVTRDSSA